MALTRDEQRTVLEEQIRLLIALRNAAEGGARIGYEQKLADLRRQLAALR